MAQPATETHDFSSSPTTSKTFTIPNKTFMVDIVGLNLGLSSSSTPDIRLGGVSTTTYQRHYHTKNADDADILNRLPVSDVLGTSNLSWGVRIYFPLLVAPTVFFSHPCSVGATVPQVGAGAQTDLTSHSTFEVFSIGGGTINAGDVHVTYHKRAHEIVEEADFTTPAATHEFTSGLNNRSTLVFVSKGLTTSASTAPSIRVSSDGGSTYDSGAADYSHNRQNQGLNAGLDTNVLYSTGYAGTTNDFLTVIENSRIAAPTSCVWGASIADLDTAPRHWMSYRSSTDKHNAYELSNTAAANFNGGSVYLLGAR